jgi:hypothetical protein
MDNDDFDLVGALYGIAKVTPPAPAVEEERSDPLADFWEEARVDALPNGTVAVGFEKSFSETIFGESESTPARLGKRATTTPDTTSNGWIVLSRDQDGRITSAFARGTSAADAQLRLERTAGGWKTISRSGDVMHWSNDILLMDLNELIPTEA